MPEPILLHTYLSNFSEIRIELFELHAIIVYLTFEGLVEVGVVDDRVNEGEGERLVLEVEVDVGVGSTGHEEARGVSSGGRRGGGGGGVGGRVRG